MNMTKPSCHLFLSWARMNGEGKALRPSYLVSMVRKLFPALCVLHPEEKPEIDQVQSLKDGRAWLVQGFAAMRTEGFRKKTGSCRGSPGCIRSTRCRRKRRSGPGEW